MRSQAFNSLLYLEPRKPPSAKPIIDHVTVGMFHIFRAHVQQQGAFMFGRHVFRPHVMWGDSFTCPSCAAALLRVDGSPPVPRSTGWDYKLKYDVFTHALCVHYLAYHRDEVRAHDWQVLEHLFNATQTKQRAETVASNSRQSFDTLDPVSFQAMLNGDVSHWAFPHPF